MWFVWALRALVILAFPIAFLVLLVHPDLGRDVTGTGIPLVAASSLILMRKLGPLHQCPGRHTRRGWRAQRDESLQSQVDDNTERLNGYDKVISVLAELAPEQWGRRKADLRLVRSSDRKRSGQAG